MNEGPWPTVVCVIPTHARDQALERALASVAAQTLPPTRVVVVDDTGSADTEAIVTRFSGTVPALYVDASGAAVKGAAASRNRGAAAAGETEFLAFLDDDDQWRPDFLRRCTALAHERGVDLVASWGAMESGGALYEHAWHAEEGLRVTDVLARNPGITGSNFVVTGPAFHRIGGFDAAQWVFNDLEFLVRFLDAGLPYAIVPEDLVVQSIEPGEHLSSRSDRRSLGITRYLGLYRERMTRTQIRVLQRQAAVARLHADQSRSGRLRYTARALASSAPSDIGRAVASRFRKDPLY